MKYNNCGMLGVSSSKADRIWPRYSSVAWFGPMWVGINGVTGPNLGVADSLTDKDFKIGTSGPGIGIDSGGISFISSSMKRFVSRCPMLTDAWALRV